MRIAMGIEYNGQHYYGWQRQRDVMTVQQALERAIAKVANQPVELTCAGRTDAGVHATNQVIHFDVEHGRVEPAWTLGVNSNLPGDIAVRWAQQVDGEFNARFSATARRYRYIIFNSPLRPGILHGGLTHIYHQLDPEPMREALPAILGEQDFTAFRAAQCQSHTPWRNITHASLTQHGDFLIFEVEANAFLHHMVRNIVGSLIIIGQGEQPPSWMAELLAGKNRKLAAATAKPNGLYLVDVTYPERFAIPKLSSGPLWLDGLLGA